MGNEQADGEAKFGSAEHQPSVALDPATRRALIRRTWASNSAPSRFTPPTKLQKEFTSKRRNPATKSKTTDLRRFCSGHHPALQRRKSLINRSEETRWRLCDNEEESYDHLWLRCPAFAVDHQRLHLGASLGELVRLPTRSEELLGIILRSLG